MNADGNKLTMAWFKDRINHYAKLMGIQKDVKYYDTRTREVHPMHLVTCMALHEAGERHHDNAGGKQEAVCCCSRAYYGGQRKAL